MEENVVICTDIVRHMVERGIWDFRTKGGHRVRDHARARDTAARDELLDIVRYYSVTHPDPCVVTGALHLLYSMHNFNKESDLLPKVHVRPESEEFMLPDRERRWISYGTGRIF